MENLELTLDKRNGFTYNKNSYVRLYTSSGDAYQMLHTGKVN